MILHDEIRTMKQAVRPYFEGGLISQEGWREFEEKISDRREKARWPSLVTKKEVAEILKITPRSVNNLMRSGKLQFIKPTGKRLVRFKIESVERLLA